MVDICQRHIRIKIRIRGNFIHFASDFRYFHPLVGNFHQTPCTAPFPLCINYAFIRIFIALSPNTLYLFYSISQIHGVLWNPKQNIAPIPPISSFAQFITHFIGFNIPHSVLSKKLCKMPPVFLQLYFLCIFIHIFHIKKNLPSPGGSAVSL